MSSHPSFVSNTVLFLIFLFCAIGSSADASSALPTVSISTDLPITKEGYVEGTVTVAGEDSVVRRHCRVKFRGSAALTYPKKAFAMKLVEQGKKVDDDLLGMCGDGSWMLDAMYIDRGRMRNRVIFDIWNSFCRIPYCQMERPGIEGRNVELTVNGEYVGIYCLSNMVNRSSLSLKKYDEANGKVRGVLYKCVHWAIEEQLNTKMTYVPGDTLQFQTFELKYPKKHPTKEAWAPLAELREFCNADSLSDDEWLPLLDKYFYMDNLVDYAILLVAFNLHDNRLKNTYLSRRDSTAPFWISPWDMDSSFGGNCWNGTRRDDYGDLSYVSRVQPYKRLFSMRDPFFFRLLAKRWNELKDNVLSVEHVRSLMMGYAASFDRSGAWSREYDKWSSSELLTDNSFDEVDYMMNWYEKNYLILNELFSKSVWFPEPEEP